MDGKLVAGQIGERKLTAREFQDLADVPPEAEWFANIQNANTRRAYKNDVHDFMEFAGLRESHEFRAVKRSHLIAWRKQLEMRALEAPTIRRKLSALSSLFDFLCESNAVEFNPADGVKRPNAGANEGKSPALSDERAKALLNAPADDTLKGVRDRAILSALLFHGLRRAELCSLKEWCISALKAKAGKCASFRCIRIRFSACGNTWLWCSTVGMRVRRCSGR
jgi:site-specific recombinase XerD